VLFSGFAIDALRQAASHLDPCVCLEKPFGVQVLESALTCALRLSATSERPEPPRVSGQGRPTRV
jgi:hypothetical protein